MFYRRKIILALLQLFEGQLEKLRLQKLLFLLSQKQEKAVYDFIPYRFGSYSYSANADLTTMVKKGYLNETETSFSKTDGINFLEQLKSQDIKLLYEIKKYYGSMNTTALIKHTYFNYPYYALNSVIAERILSKEQLQKVEAARPQGNDYVLFTIGYEGISLEAYLNKLLKNKVNILVDVRKNPISMKFGFSKSLLHRYCNSLGIEYIHIPEVGIASNKRQDLNTQSDYERLFADYLETTLKQTETKQKQIIGLIGKYKRVALTCFEADPCQCHRLHLAEAITHSTDFNYPLKHL